MTLFCIGCVSALYPFCIHCICVPYGLFVVRVSVLSCKMYRLDVRYENWDFRVVRCKKYNVLCIWKRIMKTSYDLEASVKKLKRMVKIFYCLRSKWFKILNGWNLFWPSKIKDKSFLITFLLSSPKGIWIPIIKIDKLWIKKW